MEKETFFLLFSEIFAYNWQTAQRKIFLGENIAINQQQKCADQHVCPHLRKKSFASVEYSEEPDSKKRVAAHALHVVRNSQIFLTDDVTQEHDYQVAYRVGCGRSHVAETRHEKYLQSGCDNQAENGEIGSVLRLVGKFVPEAQVEVNALENIGPKHDGHNAQTSPVTWGNDVFKQVEIYRHSQENQVGENEVILHCIGICFYRFFVFML